MTGKRKIILAAGLTIAILVLLIFSAPAIARKGEEQAAANERPGWGHGDTNHIHTGPVQNNRPNERPGNGYGDQNHVHYGYGYGYMIHGWEE